MFASLFNKLNPPHNPEHRLGYNPRIDGIRGVAALCVVLTHFDIPGFEGGMFAVDIFFVLSGFLITLVLNTNVVSNRGVPGLKCASGEERHWTRRAYGTREEVPA
jgi:peptidoglycan/LPS O-acetylase OafA/YrhL